MGKNNELRGKENKVVKNQHDRLLQHRKMIEDDKRKKADRSLWIDHMELKQISERGCVSDPIMYNELN